MKITTHTALRLRALAACMIAFSVTAPALKAEPAVTRVDKLEKENQDLKNRLDALEAAAKKEGLVPSASEPPLTVKAMSDITISGFASASYFYDTTNPTTDPAGPSPAGHKSINGDLWNSHNQFTINKVKLTLASKPVEQSGEKFEAGFKTSLIFGEDAKYVNTGSGKGYDALREAYVEANIPVGNGLVVKAGQLISLLNFESGDGGAANPNFSQGYQWWYTGNGPSAGVQLNYKWCDMVSTTARIQNGLYAGSTDGNGFKTFMASVDIKPDAKTGISVIGFAGREGASSQDYLKGASIIASRQVAEKYNINVATELDYFNQETTGKSDGNAYSAGGWVWADLTSKVGVALRADYISDGDNVGGSLLGLATPSGKDLSSLTLTLNIKPIPSFKFQPEIRYDHTNAEAAFDGGHRDRLIVGAGVTYMF